MARVHGNAAIGRFVVLSADETCFARASELWVSGGQPLDWICDPLVFKETLATDTWVVRGRAVGEARVLGIVLDLTLSANASHPSGTWLAGYLSAATTLLLHGKQLPLLLVCDDAEIEDVFQRRGALVVDRLHPADADAH